MQSKNFNTFQNNPLHESVATVCGCHGCFPWVQTALVQVPYVNLVQCCGSGFIEPDPAFQVNPDPNTDPDPIWIQGFDDQKVKKKNQLKLVFLFLIKITLYLSHQASIKDVQATGEVFHPQKSSFSTRNLSTFFLFLWVIFALLDPNTMG